jgi:hypothetical protein
MFRFTIRELVLLTLVAAIGVGWWLDRQRLTFRMADMNQRIQFFQSLQGQNRSDSNAASPQRVPIEIVEVDTIQ